jgi:hypothetical protein
MRLKLGFAMLLPWLAGCVPTMEMREGQDRDRLVSLVRQFCAAERSAAADDTAALFAEPVRHMLQTLPANDLDGRPRYVTSVNPTLVCEPGRTWYLGGSRMFAEVRLQGGSDRLDLWRGDAWRIRNVLYGRKREVGARDAKHLEAALMYEFAVPRRPERPERPPPQVFD